MSSINKAVATAAAERAHGNTGLRSQGDAWIQTQKSTFTNWVNVQLEKGGHKQAEDDGVVDAFKNGVALIQMLEIVSGKPFKRYSRDPKLRVHQIENISNALSFLKEEGLTLVNIGPEDVADGNTKLVLGLIWTIIYHYQIAVALKNAPSANAKKTSAKDLLLEWVREQIPEYNISNFNKDWNDGRALCALVNKIAGEPWVLPNHREMQPESARRNAITAIDAAHEHLAIPKILEADDLTNPNLDDLSMITYISYFKTATRVQKEESSAVQQQATEPEPQPESKPEPEPEPEPQPEPEPEREVSQPVAVATGEQWVALYEYEAADADEVSLQEGDVVVNVEDVAEGWVKGTVQRTGETGMIPSNYLEKRGASQAAPEPQEEAPAATGDKKWVAMYDYDAADADEVSFKEGDVFVSVQIVDDGWATGTNERTGESGMLPSNYIEQH
eukprot:m.64030 g.64030  ORF g.64030 m.64030 type:complete len:445 (-) comp13474_c2_seq2:59-1393(-)